ncbi:hypothetical protein FISHEDRAFT_60149 [Fistulina hepatica ATCC 64428]|uniref:Uncharacterized protein n=1 Tax=Fistulina hepatica ATCC 64428 TaxID=1128425 RepID=A0A0D7A7F4_9AGAR|nr:hypothetical protein FISHEDRAFT_60149 [Fistulina hepatica ATCC 64428]
MDYSDLELATYDEPSFLSHVGATMIAHLNALRSELISARTNLERSIFEKGATGTPIFALPNELLSKIFVATLPNIDTLWEWAKSTDAVENVGNIDFFGQDTCPLLLTRVCRRWRDVSHSTPLLWSQILVYAHYSYRMAQLNPLKVWFDRAQQAPLTIIFYSDASSSNPSVNQLLSVMAGRCRYWEDIRISLWSPDDPLPLSQFLGPVKHNVPLLRNFDLHADAVGPFDQLGDAPRLTSIGMIRHITEAINLPCDRLRTYKGPLCVRSGDSDGRNACILTLARRLERVKFIRSEETTRTHFPPIVCPSLVALDALEGPRSRAFLASYVAPNLREFEVFINYWEYEDEFVIVHSFLRFSACSLTKLSINFPRRDSPYRRYVPNILKDQEKTIRYLHLCVPVDTYAAMRYLFQWMTVDLSTTSNTFLHLVGFGIDMPTAGLEECETLNYAPLVTMLLSRFQKTPTTPVWTSD